MKTFVKENTWMLNISRNFGWGNGFVVIPKGHPLWGKNYHEIYDLMPELDVHGGLLFSEFADELDWPELDEKDKDGWVVGFTTLHYGDRFTLWNHERVLSETERLKKQLENYKPKI